MPRTLKEQALEHYDQMINVVQMFIIDVGRSELQPHMFGKVQWTSDHCVYCKKYFKKKKSKNICSNCPLTTDPSDGFNCCGGFWWKMHAAKTWRTWLKWAKRTRNYIKQNG